MIREILLPVDGSGFSEHALPVALDAARRTGARLHIVHVHEPPPLPVGPEGAALFDASRDAALRGQEEDYLNSVANRCMERAGVRPVVELLHGPTAKTLASYAAETGTDLIIMTTHGRGGISRAWVGSVADSLVRRAAVPILLIRPRGEAVDWSRSVAPRHVLVPLDGSELSETVLDPACVLGELGTARFTLMRVVLPVPFVIGPNLTPTTAGDVAAVHSLESAKSYLERMAAPLRAAGLEVRTEAQFHSAPALAILDHAATSGVDVIAMATRGRGGWSRVALGSVADKVMRGTLMPVLLYRPHAPKDYVRKRDEEEACATV